MHSVPEFEEPSCFRTFGLLDFLCNSLSSSNFASSEELFGLSDDAHLHKLKCNFSNSGPATYQKHYNTITTFNAVM